MRYFKRFSSLIYAGIFCLWPQTQVLAQALVETKVAFLADIHLQDVYGDFKSDSFRGVLNPKNGKYATIRTMKSQLNSTRLFNENYFALLEALEELREKEISLVVLPGDYTDDGQPMNVLALKEILQAYSEKYGMRFFITTGNHDPVTPFGGPDLKSDFLGENGQNQVISSESNLEPKQDFAVSSQIKNWGYFQICDELKAFGFYPGAKDIFWTNPFLPFDYEGYDFEKISNSSDIRVRLFPDPESGLMLPDASYLVEPVEGLWLLAIDGNVYSYAGDTEKLDSTAWNGSGDGFNLASKTKMHQLEWIEKITKEAKTREKTLISFSHYPLVDFHENTSEDMKKLFGKGKFQLSRVPDKQVSQLYADAGIRIHFAGHMHMNDTGIFGDSLHNKLVNIQVPSLAAFPAGYKTLTIKPNKTFTIQTHMLQDVNRFDEFFDLYKMEYGWLKQHPNSKLWNNSILDADNYLEFTRIHLQELIRLRFIKSDWPTDLGIVVSGITENQLKEWLETPLAQRGELINSMRDSIQTNNQNGALMEDFYLIKNGGDLGIHQIPSARMEMYRNLGKKNLIPEQGTLNGQFTEFLKILDKLSNGLPSDHFHIDQDLNIKYK